MPPDTFFQDINPVTNNDNALNNYSRWFNILLDSLTSDRVNNISKLVPKISILMNRANIKYQSQHVNVIMGKQIIAWGSGYIWNPTDVINNKNPMDPTCQPKGVTALNVDVSPSENLLITGVFAPKEKFKSSNEGLRIKYFGNNSDVALSWSLKGNRVINLFYPDNVLFSYGLDYNFVSSNGHNLWLECSYEQPYYWGKKDSLSSDKIFDEKQNVQSIIGYQYAFSKVRLITELYYNQIGYTHKNRPKVDSNGKLVSSDTNKIPNVLLVKALMGEIAGTGFLYYDIGCMYTINRHHSIRAFSLLNLADMSLMVRPEYEWSPLQCLRVNLIADIFVGNKSATELGSFKSNISFSASYLF
jgi:hypothetical protein